MKRILILLALLINFTNCAKKKQNVNSLEKIHDAKHTIISENTNDSPSDYSHTNVDTIITNDQKYIFTFQYISLKDKLINSHDMLYFDNLIFIKYSDEAKSIFNEKKIYKNSFTNYFKSNNIEFDLTDYIFMSCRVDSICNNPFFVDFNINLCRPDSDDCLRFVLHFDDKGNFAIMPEKEVEGE